MGNGVGAGLGDSLVSKGNPAMRPAMPVRMSWALVERALELTGSCTGDEVDEGVKLGGVG